MKKKLLILFFVLSSIVSWAQDTINIKEKNHKFLFGVTVGTFYSPKITGQGVFDNQKKQSYCFLVGGMYKLNDKFSINANIGISIFNYHFHYTFDYNDTVIYSVKNIRNNIGTYLIYNFINIKNFSIHAQIGCNLLYGSGNHIHIDKMNNYPPPLPTLNGSPINYSCELGGGVNYYIKKNNLISLNCIYDRYILNNYLLPLDHTSYIDKNIITLNLSYYFNL